MDNDRCAAMRRLLSPDAFPFRAVSQADWTWLNTPTSNGWVLCVVFGGRQYTKTRFSNAISRMRVDICEPWPSRRRVIGLTDII
ncbi:hypothetical protein FRC12_018984 [Ceratobasidium sp. 428]|nr:hypothetical protein FRC12_018984 [Ceratobasidium sp. 428]